MKLSSKVQGFRPVPLAPLSRLDRDNEPVVVYLGLVTWQGGCISSDNDLGWAVWKLSGRILLIEQGIALWDSDINLDESLGRLLQPGERLEVCYTNG